MKSCGDTTALHSLLETALAVGLLLGLSLGCRASHDALEDGGLGDVVSVGDSKRTLDAAAGDPGKVDAVPADQVKSEDAPQGPGGGHLELCGIYVTCENGVLSGMYGTYCTKLTASCALGCRVAVDGTSATVDPYAFAQTLCNSADGETADEIDASDASDAFDRTSAVDGN